MYIILLMLVVVLISVIIEAIFYPDDELPSYKEKFRRINRNENDTILDRRDK